MCEHNNLTAVYTQINFHSKPNDWRFCSVTDIYYYVNQPLVIRKTIWEMMECNGIPAITQIYIL